MIMQQMRNNTIPLMPSEEAAGNSGITTTVIRQHQRMMINRALH
jgi:hypothetical protein